MQFDAAAVSLSDLVTLVRGTTYKSALLRLPGPVLLGLASIQRDGGFRGDSLKTYGGDSAEKLLLRPGDLYVSLKDVTQSGDLLGSVARVPKSVALGRLTQDTVKLQFDSRRYPPELLYWALRSPEYRSYCRERAIGTTNLSLSRDDFLAFPLPGATPGRLELVALLEAIEQRIELLRQTSATLESIAQALFKSWFIDFDPVRAKAEGREPEGMEASAAALFPAEFEESTLGLIPKGWDVARLGDVIELAYGKALKATDRRPGRVPVYGSGGVTGSHDEALVNHASIIVGRKGTVGALYWEDEPFFPIDTTFYVKPRTAPLTFCFYAMQQLGLEHMNTDAAVPGLNRENAYRLDVVQPPASVLKAFDSLVRALRDGIRTNTIRAETLVELRDSLLPRLVSGELCLPDAQEQLEGAIA